MSMRKVKSAPVQAYWIAGTVFIAAVLATRCGTDPSSLIKTAGPQGSTFSIGKTFEPNRPFVAQFAILDQSLAAARTRISLGDEQRLILADLQKLTPEQQLFARYLTLDNQWNAGAPDNRMQAFRNAAAKAVNSLSYQRQIVPPVAINPQRTILRIDIRAYGWSRGLWEVISQQDPYATFTGTHEETEIRQRTQVGRLPYARVDWFVDSALQAPLYNTIMEIPGNLRQLEFEFGIDSDRDIQSGQVMRAGFNNSGVSSQNRLVEWHPGPFGGYWKSYDFAPENGNGRRNLFEFPLDARNFGNQVGFDFAAGEMIFQLPNGLSLYMLADNLGRRLDQALSAVVQDPVRPDANVRNGISCFRCHNAGMVKGFKDEIGPHFAKNAFAFSQQEAQIVRALYPPTAQMQPKLAAYDQRFDAALAQTGFPWAGNDSPSTESVTLTALQFEGELTVPAAAAELGLDINQFLTLIQRSDFLARRFGGLTTGSSIKRQVFEDNYEFMVEISGIGRAFNRRNFFSLTGGGDNEYQLQPPPAVRQIPEGLPE